MELDEINCEAQIETPNTEIKPMQEAMHKLEEEKDMEVPTF